MILFFKKKGFTEFLQTMTTIREGLDIICERTMKKIVASWDIIKLNGDAEKREFIVGLRSLFNLGKILSGGVRSKNQKYMLIELENVGCYIYQ